jgi:hypothetical protein
MMNPSFRRLLPLGLLLATVGCSGGLNCGSGCTDAYAYPQTAAAVPNGTAFVDDGVRMRLSQSALDFIVANLRPILASQLGTDPANPDFIVVDIPNTTLTDGVTLGFGQQETHPTRAIINGAELADSMVVEFSETPQGILLRLSDIPFGFDARIFGDLNGFADAACDIRGTNADYAGAPFLTGLTFEILLSPRVGTGSECDEAGGQGECLKIGVDVREVAIGSFDSDSIEVANPPVCRTNRAGSCDESSDCPVGSNCFSGTCVGDGDGECSEDCSDNRICAGICFNNPADSNGNVECSSACAVGDFFVDIAASIIGVIEPIIEPLLDDVMERALIAALEDVDGAPLSASGRLDIGAFIPGVLTENALDLGYAVQPTGGSAFRVSTPANGTKGMDIVLKSGFEAAPPLDPNDGSSVPHPCVRPIEGADFGALYGGRSEFFVPDSLVSPLTGRVGGEDYDLGGSLSKASLNQALFGLYNSGTFCLEIGSEAISDLSGGAVSLTAGALDLLTEGKLSQYANADAPAIVAFNPSQPPVVSYGAGTAEEGHIIINWPNVEVSFYVMMFERFSRVFAVQADLSLQIAVFNEPGTETLRVSVVDGPTISNYRENFNELLPGVSFTEVMETLVGIAFDAALGDGLEFNYDIGDALSGSLGIPVFIDFQGIETLPVAQREVLNVYLSMNSTDPSPQTVSTTRLRLADDAGVLRMADAEDTGSTTKATIPTGEVRLHLDVADAADREFFARIDFGAWRGPLLADGSDLVVSDGKLRLPGEHKVTIRSRWIGAPNSLEAEGTTVTVQVDARAPRVNLQRAGEFLVAVGSDDATNAADLEYSWTVGTADATEFAALDRLALADVDATRVTVVSRDRAGNVSRPSSVDIGTERRRLADERELKVSFGNGCSSTGSSTGAMVAALAMMLARRRRSR